MQNFRKLRCHEICEPENGEINESRKFHVIRYVTDPQLTFPLSFFESQTINLRIIPYMYRVVD